MNILISNDDGIESPGIVLLAEALGKLGEVTVVAPHRERSTAGHSLTLHKPLRIQCRRPGFYATSGTPADCIYLGIREILGKAPDLIVSGINAGANLGTDVHYSGTVAAAREGALMNIKSFAVSLVDLVRPPELPRAPLNFEMAAGVAADVIGRTMDQEFSPHTLLNINIPNVSDAVQIEGVRVARQGIRYYTNDVTRRQDPRDLPYYWIGGNYKGFEENPVSDCHWVNERWVSLTPLTIDCTHDPFYARLLEQFPDGLPKE